MNKNPIIANLKAVFMADTTIFIITININITKIAVIICFIIIIPPFLAYKYLKEVKMNWNT